MKKVNNFTKKISKFCAENRLQWEIVKSACYPTIRIYPETKTDHAMLLNRFKRFKSMHIGHSPLDWNYNNDFIGYITLSDKKQHDYYNAIMAQRNILSYAFFEAAKHGSQAYAKQCEEKYAMRKNWMIAFNSIYNGMIPTMEE